MNTRVVIVGASLAGVRTAQALRRNGFRGSITLIGAEKELPYDRPPLSKDHLASDGQNSPVPLVSTADLAALELELRLGTRAVGLDPVRKAVEIEPGGTIGYDVLVIATGARARELPLAQGLAGFQTLRTVDDACRLREALDSRPRVAVVGGGFIGAEVAVAARGRGLDVTVIEMLPAPMSRALGTEVGEVLAELHREHGVSLRCGTTVVGVRGESQVTALQLADDSLVPADHVVVGLGAEPETEWLAGSGLNIIDGVLCDEGLRAVGVADLYAVGDIARWRHPGLDKEMRVEHWTSAQEHADVVASRIMGGDATANALPYVWSDQYKRRIQIIGRPEPGDDVTLLRDPVRGNHVAVYAREGKVSALFGIDSPKKIVQGRRAILKNEDAEALLARL